MKFLYITLAILPIVLGRDISVGFTRTNGEKVTLGPGPGCFGTVGQVSNIQVGEGGLAVFYSEYGCKGNIVYDRLEGEYEVASPFTAVSVDIIDTQDQSCSPAYDV